MKLTIGLKLKTTAEDAAALKETLHLANQAANEISRLAWDAQEFGQFALHKLTYKTIRAQFPLSAQIVVRVISKVADAYKLDKKVQRTFRADGSIAYDDRILSFKPDAVSIWTTKGRLKIPFVCGERERKLLTARQGESDLVFRKGKWFLFVTINVIEPPVNEPDGFLGVDLGIARIATDSDGESFSGEVVEKVRQYYHSRRQTLQVAAAKRKQRGHRPKNINRKLKQLGQKESLFRRDVNHVISKKLVEKAKDTQSGIAVEDLKGIRERIRFGKTQRAKMSGWSFFQLRAFVEYKARLAGVPTIAVDPRHTSQMCSKCGHTEKANRKSQSEFCCRACGFTLNADFNAALNIRAKAAVNQPMVSKSAAGKAVRVQTQAPSITASV